MTMWPIDWQVRALDALRAPDSESAYAIMTAWCKSTPLPPYSYNPLGMPAGSSGAKAYLATPYAQFGSIGMFYDALKAFASTVTGKSLITAMSAHSPYPGTWRAIASLKWPGSATETDYPSAVLDLTDASYRAYIKATPRPMRKTSGMLTAPHPHTTTAIAQARSVNQATQAFTDANSQVSFLLRRHASNGLRILNHVSVAVDRDKPGR